MERKLEKIILYTAVDVYHEKDRAGTSATDGIVQMLSDGMAEGVTLIDHDSIELELSERAVTHLGVNIKNAKEKR